jgi:hypothetical protein
MAKKKEKRREPYRKSSRMGKRGVIPFLIPLILVALLIVFFMILIKNPQICLFGNCWRPVSLRLSTSLGFWLIFAGFVLLQVGIVWLYWVLITKTSQYILLVKARVLDWTTNIKRYIISHS